ncbi:MAG: Dabb family protein [Labilithrix sp.]|nr:Dabb family protein [Labilithrix sp.]
MIINYLRFRFRDDVGEEAKERALVAIRRIASSEAVAFSVIGQDLGDPAAGYTHSYCVAIPDLAALARYLADPAHREGDLIFLPLLAKLARSASSDDNDPALRDKVNALARERLATDPEWAGLFARIPDLQLG